MSWLSYCYKTYQNSVSEIGKQQPGKVPLLPVAHTTQQVNIEVELDKDGNFQYAGLLAQDQRTTIIPCTEESSARTSGMVPHPLVDKLQYIAADYPTFGGSKESGWPLYHKQLQAWCTSPYAHPAVCTVLHYLEKECLIADLVKANILFIDENGTLPTKWQGNKEDKPPILDTLTGSDQTESFVRFRVDNVDLSRDTTVRESFMQRLPVKPGWMCAALARCLPLRGKNPRAMVFPLACAARYLFIRLSAWTRLMSMISRSQRA